MYKIINGKKILKTSTDDNRRINLRGMDKHSNDVVWSNIVMVTNTSGRYIGYYQFTITKCKEKPLRKGLT